MSQVRFTPRGASIRYVLFLALAFSFTPLATADAQPSPFVQVTSEDAPILSTLHLKRDVVMTPAKGTLFEVIHTEGDRFNNRSDNWYWVLLPRDAWGTQRVGWISGRDVQPAPRPVTATPAATSPIGLVDTATGVVDARPMPPQPDGAVAVAAAATLAPAPEPASSQPAAEVVLNFSFGKSDLSDDAKSHLAGAVAKLNGPVQAVSFALEGHADSTGPEGFNEKLGLARAETVKRYLAEQHQIPADKIKAVSYGETHPVAPNETREGRAQNRRVVVKAGP